MKNLKKIVALMCVLVLALSLTACGGGGKGKQIPLAKDLLKNMPGGDGLTADMTVHMAMDMAIMGEEMSMTMDSESSLEQGDGNVHSTSSTKMVSGEESETESTEVYSVQNDDGTYTEYINVGGSWTKYVYEDPTVGLNGAMDIPADGFTVSESDGLYVVSGTVNLADALQAMGDTSTFDAFGLTVEDMMNAEGSLDVKAEYRFDKDSEKVQSFTLDMGAAMNTLLNEMMGGALAAAAEDSGEDLGDVDLSSLLTINVSAMTLDVTDIQMDDGLTVNVPADVVSSAVEGTVE